jgi:pectate lyase
MIFPKRPEPRRLSLTRRDPFSHALLAIVLVLFSRSLLHAAAPGCVGFAAVDGDNSIGMSIAGGTTGGAGGTTVTVTTQAQLDSAASQVGPYYIQVSGMVPLAFGHQVSVASDKTIVGVGCGSGILYGGLSIDGSSNVIVQGLAIGESYVPGDPTGSCCNDDAIAITNQAHHVWVDHCDLYHCNDGLVDITHQANYVTVSWCKFHDHNKVSTIGHSNSATTDSGYLKVTYHHNWFQDISQSAVRMRFGLAHLFDNFYSNIATYCTFDTMAAQVVEENNYFGPQARNPYVIGTPTPTYQPLLSASGNFFDPSATGSQDTYGSPFDPATFYAYSLDPASAVPTLAVTGTGPCGYAATPTPTPSLPATVVWRINAGGPSYVDGGGQTWVADTQFLKGYAYQDPGAPAIAGTTDDLLYQSERYGSLYGANSCSYYFPVPTGYYQVTLKFAETDFTSAGQRAFNVAINGTTVLSNFDIAADAGGANKADDKVFDYVYASGGKIQVQFTAGSADSPKVNALQVVPEVVPPTPTPPAPSNGPYVYSNPTSGPTVSFVYNMAENGKAFIRVWNASGVIVGSLQEVKPAGQQVSVMNVQSFAPGHYFYQVDLKYDSGREDRSSAKVLAVRK